MKKTLILLLFIGFYLTGTSQTQNIKIGPLGFVFGNYNLRYEKVLSEKGTFQVGANAYNYKIFGETVSGFGIDAGYRQYFKEAMKGPYVYPALNYDFNNTNLSGFDEKFKYSILGIGATIGWQWLLKNNFVIDLGLGYGYSIEVSKDDSLIEDYGGGGLRFQFAIGYAF